jgi:sugar lactone lactonase YvrE
MRNFAGAITVAATLAFGQAPEPVQLHHLYTFGSKQGIHPPRILSSRPARVALGQGEHPYGLVFPVGVTTDLHRRVWITDSGTASVHVFDRGTGAYQEIRRTAGIPLQQPSGIAADRAGRIYVTDSGSGGVFVFDEKGEYDRALVKPGEGLLESPTAIALSEDERTVFVADSPRSMVMALNREGEVNGTIRLPPELSEPSAVSVLGNQVYVLGNRQHRVGIFSPAGKPRGELRWDGIQFPSAFTFNAEDGRFLVADPRWMIVEIFNEAGQKLGAFCQLGDGIDQVQRVDALHVDPQGLVYLIDSRHGKVLVFGDFRHP